MNKGMIFRSQKTEAEIVGWLKSSPAAKVSHDLAPVILARVKAERKPGWDWLYPLAAAATVALLLGGVWLTGSRGGDPSQQAMAWLCQTQEPDGSWSTARWGGDKHFEVALTGLSLLTLLDQGHDCDASVDRAITYLLRCQQADGQFGESFSGLPYNQGIATLALAKAYGTRKSQALQAALDRAVLAICARQYADGGWGYHKEAHPSSNLSITLWQVEALRLASLNGWAQTRPNIERGLRWMAGVASDDGSFGYQKSGDTPGAASQTLTAMGAMSLLDGVHANLMTAGRRQAIKAQMQRLAANPGPDLDYYRRYFLTAALKKMGEESERGNLSLIRRDLVARQVRQGNEAGSWKADDRWGSSGGRIYATAMASLSLR